jgi:hypothetical protein
MTSAMNSGVPWLAAGTVVVFLIVCVWHNRRIGYRRVRAETITIGQAMAQIRISLSLSRADWVLSATREQAAALNVNSTAGQLVCLNSALGQKEPQVHADAAVEERVTRA